MLNQYHQGIATTIISLNLLFINYIYLLYHCLFHRAKFLIFLMNGVVLLCLSSFFILGQRKILVITLYTHVIGFNDTR